MIEWSSDKTFELGETTFRIGTFYARAPAGDAVHVLKPRWMVDHYATLAAELPNPRMIELGIAQGGSVAFFAELFRPERFLAIELDDERVAGLDDYLTRRGFADSVVPVFGVNQSDRNRVRDLVDHHFGEQQLDLVVDDASHLLEPTMVSFDLLFPRLRTGGLFILEDWSAQQTYERVLRTDPERFADELGSLDPLVGLSRLALQLVLMVGDRPDIASEVQVFNGFLAVRRGEAPIPTDGFDPADYYGEIAERLLGP